MQKSFDSKSAGELADDMIDLALNAISYFQNYGNSIVFGAKLFYGIVLIIQNLLSIQANGQNVQIKWYYPAIGWILGLMLVISHGNYSFKEIACIFYVTGILDCMVDSYITKSSLKISFINSQE